MKYITFTLALLLSTSLFGQNDSIEKAIFYNQFLENHITQDDLREKGLEWNQLIESSGGYPQLSLYENGKLAYDFYSYFPGWSKADLYKRTLEWLAIEHGMVPAYVYSNQEDGKIIYATSPSELISFTFVISIRKENVFIEHQNITYQQTTGGYYRNDVWIEEEVLNKDFNSIFPIILKKSYKWNRLLILSRLMNDKINNSMYSFEDYINAYKSKYTLE